MINVFPLYVATVVSRCVQNAKDDHIFYADVTVDVQRVVYVSIEENTVGLVINAMIGYVMIVEIAVVIILKIRKIRYYNITILQYYNITNRILCFSRVKIYNYKFLSKEVKDVL